jgi:hypothetical protein
VQPFKPKVVLWVYSETTDLIDLQLERKSKLLTHYLDDGFTQNLLQRQSEIDAALGEEIPKQIERHRQDWSNGSVAHFLHGMKDADATVKTPSHAGVRVIDRLVPVLKLNALRERFGLIYGTDKSDVDIQADLEGPNIALFRDVISNAEANVKAWGGTLYFVYIPAAKRFVPEDHTVDVRADFGMKERERVLTLVTGLGVPIIDICSLYEAQKDPAGLLYFRKPSHYNEEGHRLIAEALLKALSHPSQSAALGRPPAEPHRN